MIKWIRHINGVADLIVLKDHLRDIEPEPAAVRCGSVCAVKSLKEVRQIRLIDMCVCIDHSECRTAVSAGEPYGDAAVFSPDNSRSIYDKMDPSHKCKGVV